MPVYERTYRSFDGTVQRHFRWFIILRQETRVLITSRIFRVIMLFALLNFLLRLLQIYGYDSVVQDPDSLFAPLFREIPGFAVTASLFYDFLRMQTSFVFLAFIFAGSGMICNDFNNNLIEVYFSKPISWLDYALGKILTLVFIGLCVTAIPGLVLVVMHNLFLPGMETVRESAAWLLPILGYSLVVVVPCALAVLAGSAVMRSRNFAAVAVFMLLIADSTLSAVLARIMRNANYRILSMPAAMRRIGQQFFGEYETEFDLRWEWALLVVVLVSIAALGIVLRRARRAEVAA